MKKYLFFLAVVVMSACSDDDPKPDNSDPLIGRWFFQKSSEDLTIGFTVGKKGTSYELSNVVFEHPNLPEGVTFQYEILPKSRQDDGWSFGAIELNGTGGGTWVAVTLTNVTVYSDAMDADKLELEIEGTQPLTLEYPVIDKL